MESTQISARALLMMLSKLVSHLCFLLLAVVLARTLEQADFGTFNQVWLINKSLIYLFAVGLPVSVYYFLPQLTEGKAKSFVVQTIFSLAILALPFSLLTYLLADPVAIYFQNSELAEYLRLFAIYPLMVLPTVATDAVLISLARTKQAAVFEIITKVAMILAVATAGMLGHRLDLVFKALILHALAQLFLALWVMWQPLRNVRWRFSRADLKSQIAFAMPYGLSDLAGVLNYQADKVLVALFYPPAAFAVYAAGAFEIPLAGVTSVPVLSVSVAEFTRRFTAGDITGFLTLWHQSLTKLALPVFAVAAFLMVFAEPIVTGLFSSKYAASVWPFQIYLLLLPIRITIPGQVLASLGETKFVFKAMVASMIVNVVLGYILIRSLGWLGPAFSAVASGYLFATLIMREIRKRLAVSLHQLMPWKALGRVALVAALAAVASLPVAFVPIAAAWKLGAGFIIYGIVYVIGNVKTNSITASDLEILRNWLSLSSRGGFAKGMFESGIRK